MSSDRFNPISASHLMRLIVKEYKRNDTIFGIPKSQFFRPLKTDAFRLNRFGQLLENPIGVAAGPHTQLSQNIVVAWLTGARYIELKTVQTLDNLTISKPCIDMYDEGYNCEWSQELTIEETVGQYVDAWVVIHYLKDLLQISDSGNRGFIFNMSVGYNYEGILKPNVQYFFEKMNNAKELIEERVAAIKKIYTPPKAVVIEAQISNNITLSTMHGCPPDEIEKIGRYLIADKKLHTTIKLNPTLIGKERVNEILKESGFPTDVPDEAFEHDLKYADAIQIIKNLQQLANETGVEFGVKLTNTLESMNNRNVFPENEKMMYMSGRALHPLSVNTAALLQREFEGNLDISFCGGATANNIYSLVSGGLFPVTVCSDILKPGGYMRLSQYISNLRGKAISTGATDIDSLIYDNSSQSNLSHNEIQVKNIEQYAKEINKNREYSRKTIQDPNIKTDKPLGYFDCIFAPCEDTCPTNQNIPNYNYYTSIEKFDKAAEIIRQTNPFPKTTGMICDHLCQTKCTRINYDNPVLIRDIKRFIAEQENTTKINPQNKTANKRSVAIIGAGPSGLSCAYFLAKAGFKVTIFESKTLSGGMISGVIPAFRLTDKAIADDITKIEALGVEINQNTPIDAKKFNELKSSYNYTYIAAGAQKSATLKINGLETNGVLDPLQLLEDVKQNKIKNIGKKIAIIGGGNTAMDVARTALRLVGNDGKVTIVYRRTIKEMPADQGEIKAVMKEGVQIMELTAPENIISKNGKITALACSRMKLGDRDESGRRRPVKIENSEFNIEVDALIPAVGQELAFDFGFKKAPDASSGSYETEIKNVFMGGDALRGASTAINAIGDGRKVAQHIIDLEGIDFETKPTNFREPKSYEWHLEQRALVRKPTVIEELPLNDRKNFKIVTPTLTKRQAIAEASSCLLCDEFCSICTTVCPNLANVTYQIEPATYTIQEATNSQNGNTDIKSTGSFKITQQYQILNIANFCNECGNCATFCPTSGAPYLDKPKIYLTKSDFDKAQNGFYLQHEEDKQIFMGKKEGKEFTLTVINKGYIYEDSTVKAELASNMAIKEILFKTKAMEKFDTKLAISMRVILQGAQNLVFTA
ncbi:MAG: putative selenate reductase subunit YgfK [Salinivirgaceae bacterium]|nr:putative selenate reductase subunit YgfK [Salinivirgaceae bacterium]